MTRGRRKSGRSWIGIIGACLGLHLEAVTEKPMAQPGENLALQIEAINRSPVDVKFQVASRSDEGASQPVGKALSPNELMTEKHGLLAERYSVFRALLVAPARHGWHLHGLRSNTDRPTGESAAVSDST